MKLIAYLRVSSESQTDGYGFDIQDGEVTTWAKRHGHRIVATHTEVYTASVGYEERAELAAALADVVEGRGDGLLIPKLDRLARSVTVQEAALALVWRDGGRVFSAEAGEILKDDPDDPYRTAMREMAGVFAGLERRVIVKRLRDGRRAKAAAGKHSVGQYAYGLRGEGHGRERDAVPSAEEQGGIAFIVALREESNTSYRDIARALDTAGYRPRRAQRWSAVAVRNVYLRATG
jgi:DNA invertase Pin-like site-specific DNA recombinase